MKTGIRGIGVDGVASEIGALGRHTRSFNVSRQELAASLERRFDASRVEVGEAIRQALAVGVIVEVGDRVELVTDPGAKAPGALVPPCPRPDPAPAKRDLLCEVQQKLEAIQRNPLVTLHQTRDTLAVLCNSVKILLSGTAPNDPPTWLQEFQYVNDLRVLAEQYLESFLAVKGKTP